MSSTNHSIMSRRDLLRKASAGFQLLSLTALLAEESNAATQPTRHRNPLAAKRPHFPPRAKSVIFLFMGGGPSQVDLFDPKPKLADHADKKIPIKLPRITRDATLNCRPSPYKFKQHGESGLTKACLESQISMKEAEDMVMKVKS